MNTLLRMVVSLQKAFKPPACHLSELNGWRSRKSISVKGGTSNGEIESEA